MNMQEYINKLRELAVATTAQATLAIRVPAANRMRANVINRISNDGKATDGSKIGSYSTKPAYFSKAQFVRKGSFKPQGKVRKGTKTMYIPTGYHGLRQIQGRRTDMKNLQYSGDMLLDFRQETQGSDILIGFIKKKESDKRKGNEKRAGKKILTPSQQEINEYNKECAEGYKELITSVLK